MENNNQFIKMLVSNKFSIFNVGIDKAPINSKGRKMGKWISMSYDELVKEHNYDCNLWGMKMGLQENNRMIMSLDFDVCGKKNSIGERIGCSHTQEKLDEYLKSIDRMDGMFSSSTQGNMNVLIDYTNIPSIYELVKTLNTNKTTFHDLEILMGGNQVIPPTQTNCKITGVLGQARCFKNEEPFYVLNENDSFVINFVTGLLTPKLPKQKPVKVGKTKIQIKKNTVDNLRNDIEFVDVEPINDKHLELIFDVIKNERDINGCKIISRDDWFKICGILKYNNYDKNVWLDYSQTISNSDSASKLWDGIKNTTPMSIYGLQNIAKKYNRLGYKNWLIKYNSYIPIDILNKGENDIAQYITPILQQSLTFCDGKWWGFNNMSGLWTKNIEPSAKITNTIQRLIDEALECVLSKMNGLPEGDPVLGKLISFKEMYNRHYVDVCKSSFNSQVIKYLKSYLLDNEFVNKLDCLTNRLAFKDGILDLKTLEFRNGILYTDYITKTILYDYKKPDEKKMEKLKEYLKPIMNNNEEHLEYLLSILGFCFLGTPHLEKSVYFCVDKTLKSMGDNGKTFFFDILTHVMPCYVYKAKGTMLEEGNTKVHKQLAMLKGMLLVWCDEFSRTKTLYADLLKVIGDGNNVENEVMFGTSEIINVMFKLFILTNHIPKINADENAVYNRYKQLSFNSHFDRTGKRLNPNPEKLQFIADINLGDTIKNEYIYEVIGLIAQYANKYITGTKIPSIPQQFLNDIQETKDKNDEFGKWFNENCEENETERISLEKIIELTEFGKTKIINDMLRMGYKYDRLIRGFGKNNLGNDIRGGFKGLKLKPQQTTEEQDIIEE